MTHRLNERRLANTVVTVARAAPLALSSFSELMTWFPTARPSAHSTIRVAAAPSPSHMVARSRRRASSTAPANSKTVNTTSTTIPLVMTFTACSRGRQLVALKDHDLTEVRGQGAPEVCRQLGPGLVDRGRRIDGGRGAGTDEVRCDAV